MPSKRPLLCVDLHDVAQYLENVKIPGNQLLLKKKTHFILILSKKEGTGFTDATITIFLYFF